MFAMFSSHVLIGLMHLPAFLAAAFITPGFFAAGAALVGIPILIHILNRRRFKIVKWAAMEYLLQAMRKNRRRLKFEQWILLLTRCLLVMLLGAALARPLACDTNPLSAFTGQRHGLHVFIIDNGYSMSYETPRQNAKTQLEQAKLIAKQYISRLQGGGEAVMLITTGKPASLVIPKPSYDLESASAAVDRIEQSYTESDIGGALELAVQAGKDAANLPHKSLYILSDNTRCSWQGAAGDKIKAAASHLPEVYRTTVHMLGKPDQWNMGVLNLKPDANLVSTKFSVDLLATVHRFGGNGGPANLQWKIDDNTTSSKDVTVEGEVPPVINPSQSIPTGGPHVLSVTLASDDHLKDDNTRLCVVNVVNELKVLIVEGQRGLGALEGSGSFLQLALAPPRDPMTPNNAHGVDSDSPVSPDLIGDTELPNKVLSNYRAIILTDVGSITETAAQQLEKFVEDGGTLMLFMGKDVNGDAYNRLLLGNGPDGKPRHLLPGKLVKVMSSELMPDKTPFEFAFDPEGVLHPYLKVFQHESNSGLSSAQIFSYWQVDLPGDGNVERVLNYKPAAGSNAAGDPAITLHRVGEGRVVFFSTTANAEWTSFPAKPNYVTLVNELLAGSVNPGDRWQNLQTGQSLEVPTTLGLPQAPSLLDPQKKPIALDTDHTPAGDTVYRSRPLQKPGLYKLMLGPDASLPIAVNVPANAMDVRTVAEKSVRDAMGNIDFEIASDQLPADVTGQNHGNEMSWYFMAAVLVLAGVESFMAMRFGHHRRAGAHAQTALGTAAGEATVAHPGARQAMENALGVKSTLSKSDRNRQNAKLLMYGSILWLVADVVMASMKMHVSNLSIAIPIGLIIGSIWMLVRSKRSKNA